MIDFRNPLPLGALLASLVILGLVHLLFRRRPVERRLPTLEFLFSGTPRLRRRHLRRPVWLFWLRLLLLLLAAVLLMRPRGDRTTPGPVSTGELFILLDDSASMAATLQGESVWERARRVTQQLLDQQPPEARVRLIRLCRDPAEEMPEALAAGDPRLREALARLTVCRLRPRLYPNLRALLSRPGAQQARVVLISDFQASGFREFQASAEGPSGKWLEGISLECIDCRGGPWGEHASIQALGGDTESSPPGLPVVRRCQVTNHGSASRPYRVRLLLDGAELQRRVITLAGGASTEEVWTVPTPESPGDHTLEWELEPVEGSDGFASDRRARSVLTTAPSPRILVVNGQPSPDPLEDETAYLLAALQTGEPPAGQRRGSPAPRTVTAVQWQGLAPAALQETLGNADLLILANLPRPDRPPQHSEAIRGFVQAGGGVLILPGRQVEAPEWNRLFQPPQGEAWPVRLGSAEAATGQRLQWVAGGPLAARVNVTRGSTPLPLEAVRFETRYPLDTPDASRTTVLARWQDGSPAVMTGRFGRGRWTVAGFAVNARESRLPLRGHDFVPLVVALTLGSRGSEAIEWQRPPDAPWRATLQEVPDPVTAVRVGPDGERTPLSIQRVGNQHLTAIPLPEAAGFARIEWSRAGRPRPEWVRLVGVDVEPEESDPTVVTPQALAALLPQARVQFAHAADAGEPSPPSGSRELAPLLLLGLLLYLGVELLLSTPRAQAM